MPDFIVTTVSDRNLIIKADKFGPSGDGGYAFFTNGEIVAIVPHSPEILAIAEYDEAFQADFYTYDDPEDEDEIETDDVCLDCRFAEFLESQEFASAVLDYVQIWHDLGGAEPDFGPTQTGYPEAPKAPTAEVE